MPYRLFRLICTVFVLTPILLAQEPKWLIKIRQVVPLKSTQEDVKKLFGKATRRYANIEKYETKDGILTVTYSTGECTSNLANYDIQKGIVVDINFLLKKPINFKLVNEDISNFEKEESSDTQNERYKSPIEGIEYGVFVRNKQGTSYENNPRFLNSISIYPAKKYSNLECSNSVNRIN